MKKRLISLLVAAMLVMGMLPAAALAAEELPTTYAIWDAEAKTLSVYSPDLVEGTSYDAIFYDNGTFMTTDRAAAAADADGDLAVVIARGLGTYASKLEDLEGDTVKINDLEGPILTEKPVETVEYTVTYANGEGYTVAVEPEATEGKYEEGTEITVTVTIAEGYEALEGVTINGEAATANEDGTYSVVIVVAEDVTVEVAGITAKVEESDPSDTTDPSDATDPSGSQPTDPSTPGTDPSNPGTTDPTEPEEDDKDTGNADVSKPAAPSSGNKDKEEPTEPATEPSTEAPEKTYGGVAENHWAFGYVQSAYDKGLLEGVDEVAVSFEADGVASRAMIVSVLYNAAGKPAAEASTFTDVADGVWYEGAVDWAAANGITNGVVAGVTFDPAGNVTREMMATFLWRYAGQPAVTADLSGYTDAADVSDWAKAAMEWAVANGIINGRTTTTLVPQGTVTRAELVTMVDRLLNLGK